MLLLWAARGAWLSFGAGCVGGVRRRFFRCSRSAASGRPPIDPPGPRHNTRRGRGGSALCPPLPASQTAVSEMPRAGARGSFLPRPRRVPRRECRVLLGGAAVACGPSRAGTGGHPAAGFLCPPWICAARVAGTAPDPAATRYCVRSVGAMYGRQGPRSGAYLAIDIMARGMVT